MQTEIIDKLYLELSQISNVKTAKEIRLENGIREAVRIIYEGKRLFTPNTTNSDADEFLKKWGETK